MNEKLYNASMTNMIFENNYMKEYFVFKKFANRTLYPGIQKFHAKYPYKKPHSLCSFFGQIKKNKNVHVIISKSKSDISNYTKNDFMSLFSNFSNKTETIYIDISTGTNYFSINTKSSFEAELNFLPNSMINFSIHNNDYFPSGDEPLELTRKIYGLPNSIISCKIYTYKFYLPYKIKNVLCHSHLNILNKKNKKY
jgi:hypothetical protein